MRLRNLLVVTEIALALVLLVGAGLLFNSFMRLQYVDPGFDPEPLVGTELRMDAAHHDEVYRRQFVHALIERLEAMPQVESAAVCLTVPFLYHGGRRTGWFNSKWTNDLGEEREIFTPLLPATPGYFATLGVTVTGRELTAADNGMDPMPVVVSEDFAMEVFDTPSPLGRVFTNETLTQGETTSLQVVGIARGIHHWGLDQGTEAQLYMPWDDRGAWLPFSALLIRSTGDAGVVAGMLREVVWSIDPALPLPEVFTMRERIGRSLTVPRFYLVMLITFAVVAFLLAGAGIYGSMLYTVGRRRREMGIRTALGADPGRLVRLILRQGALLTLFGLLLGLGGAAVATRALESMVYGISTTDLPTYLAGSLLLGVVAMTACFFPAWKAAGTDPVEVMRT